MYRSKTIKKLLCMLITFSLLTAGSAFQVLAASLGDDTAAVAELSEETGVGLMEVGESSVDSVLTDQSGIKDSETGLVTDEDNTQADPAAADDTESAGDADPTEHSSESTAGAAESENGSTDSKDSSSADSSLTDSSLTDSSLTDSSLTDSSVAEEEVVGSVRNDITDGLYVIQSALNTKACLGIKSSSRDNSANVELVSRNGGYAQAFYIKKVSDGVYSFINYNSNKVLHARGAGKTAGTNIVQYSQIGSVAQKWIVRDAATAGYVTIQASYCNLMLDCYAGKSAVGTNVHLNKAVSAKRQMWKLVPASGKVALEASLVDAGIEKGYYTIGLNSESSQVLDVAAGSKDSGANVQIYKTNGTYAQAFQILPQGNGLYKIKNVNSGKYLATASGTGYTGNIVQKTASSGDASQVWHILKDPTNNKLVFRTSNAYHAVITTASNATASGTNVRNENFAGSVGQYWTLSKTTVYEKDAIYKPSEVTCFIYPAAASQKAVGVAGGSLYDAGNVQLTSRSSSNALKWRVIPNGDGTYTIQNVKSGKALDVSGANFTSGSNVQQYTSNGTNAQKWVFRRTGDVNGSFYIVSADNNYVLDIAGARYVTGSNIWLYARNNTGAQKYLFAKTSVTSSGWATAKSGNRYYYSKGERLTGWQKIGSYYYYFRGSGIMARNTTVDGYAIDSEGRSNKTDFKTATGGRTIRALLTNAVAPAGKVLYIWGGGHGGMGNSVQNDSSKIGILPTWTTFYNNTASPSYDYNNYRWQYGMGLDCSGFVGWAVYNTIYTKDNVEDIDELSSSVARSYINRGWCYDSGHTFKPGDVVSRSGHVWISMGTCEDGSVLIMHSTPQGVQLTGTEGKSVELAVKYMKLVAPNWPFSIKQYGSGYLTYVGKATWKVDGSGILTDPDGMQNMTAEQVCKIVFGS